jgi:hypothetical protein
MTNDEGSLLRIVIRHSGFVICPMRLEDELPGLKAAEAKAAARETELRERTWLPLNPLICGVSVLPLTLRHFTLLHTAQSPLVVGAPGDFQQCMQFLWIVSPGHIYPTAWIPLKEVRAAREAWTRKIWPRLRRRNLGAVCKAILLFVEEALFDLGKSSASDEETGEAGRSTTHFNASLIDEFGDAYGWLPQVLDARGLPLRDQGIRDMPLAQLIQLRRARTARKYPNAVLANPLSDSVAPRMLRELIAREKAAAAGPPQGPRTKNQEPRTSEPPFPDARKSKPPRGKPLSGLRSPVSGLDK